MIYLFHVIQKAFSGYDPTSYGVGSFLCRYLCRYSKPKRAENGQKALKTAADGEFRMIKMPKMRATYANFPCSAVYFKIIKIK